MKKIKLREIAHGRSGDKKFILNLFRDLSTLENL